MKQMPYKTGDQVKSPKGDVWEVVGVRGDKVWLSPIRLCLDASSLFGVTVSSLRPWRKLRGSERLKWRSIP